MRSVEKKRSRSLLSLETVMKRKLATHKIECNACRQRSSQSLLQANSESSTQRKSEQTEQQSPARNVAVKRNAFASR